MKRKLFSYSFRRFNHRKMRLFYILLLFTLASFAHSATCTIIPAEELFNNVDRIEHKNILLPATGAIKLGPALITVCSLAENTVYQIASDATDNLYLSARNTLYRKPRGSNRLQQLYQDNNNEILTLTVLPDRTVFFGTTPEGKIYRIMPGGIPQPVANTGATYISFLLPAPDRSVLCATGPEGKLLRIYPDGRQQTVFTASQAHITTLTWLKPGEELLAGTSPDGIVYRLIFSPSGGKPRVTVFYDTPLEEIRAIVYDGQEQIYIAGNPDAESGNRDGPSQPAVYLLNTDGIPSWQWLCPDSVIYNIHLHNQRLLVLTGNRGIMYTLENAATAQPAIVARLAEAGATAITRSGKTLYLGSSNPARLYQLTDFYADSGSVTGVPFDCGAPAQFGQLQVRAQVPAGTELTIATRSGNSSIPDSTWSEWQPLAPLPGRIASPPARFIQWQATLATRFPDRTPQLERIDLFYRPVNRAPLVNRLEINQPSEVDARRGNVQFRRQISWDAVDPDEDSLVFQLFIRPEKENIWQALDTNLTETRYELDTRTLPDGWYYLRLTVSDRTDRPYNTALSTERISSPFIIDNTPPEVAGLKISGAKVSWTVRDRISPIAFCRVAINAGSWRPLEPADGIYDEQEESFTLPLPDGAEIKTVAIWATDALGNSTTAREFVSGR